MATTEESNSSTHVFVWAWDVDKDADDFLAVVDVDRRSSTYGQVVSTLPAPGGRGAHHVEYEMSTSRLFANSFETGHTFVFDLSDPVRPRLFSDFGDAGPYSHPHSFARTPSGTVLATYQGLATDHRATGGLVELDSRGRMLRATSAASPLDRDIRPYSLAVVPQLDRVVTTSRLTCTEKEWVGRFRSGGFRT
jgi:selenium-binding protein 1